MKFVSQKLSIQVLLFSTFIVSICGLSYELLIGSLSTNLEGNPILQYSLTIGFFMSALGFGSYLSRFFLDKLLYQFIIIEIILGIIGGLSVPSLNIVYIYFYPVYTLSNILVLVIIGTLVGLEIPLITRILQHFDNLKDTISNVLTMDYIGGLVASLVFPLILYPYVGLIKTAFIIGFVNVLVGIVSLLIFSKELDVKQKIPAWVTSLISLILLAAGIIFSSWLTGFYSRAIYGTVLYNKQSRYQNIVINQRHGNTNLYLDGHLQFASSDEYRYHEALVFPPFFLKDNIKKILIMGGGDGLAVREILKFDRPESPIEKIILVDLDSKMTDLSKNFSLLKRLNLDSFNNPKVEIVNMDAYKYLGITPHHFDIIYADFTDPHDTYLSKLYSLEFYHFVKRRLAKDGLFLTQATSPLHAKKVYWCTGNTLKEVFKTVLSYHVDVPSMGDWGFHIATDSTIDLKERLVQTSDRFNKIPYHFFSKDIFLQSLTFAKDSLLEENESVKINRFAEPIIYEYFRESWQNVY